MTRSNRSKGLDAVREVRDWKSLKPYERFRLRKRGINVPIFKPGIQVIVDEKKLVNLYNSGTCIKDLEEIFGYCHESLYKILRANGVIINRSERAKMVCNPPHLEGCLSSHWKGGRKKNKQGYILIQCKTHPRADTNGCVREHLVVWERSHNRQLPKGYCIHHLNGIKDDNRSENLIAVKNSDHHRLSEPYKKRIRELELEILRLRQMELFK